MTTTTTATPTIVGCHISLAVCHALNTGDLDPLVAVLQGLRPKRLSMTAASARRIGRYDYARNICLMQCVESVRRQEVSDAAARTVIRCVLDMPEPPGLAALYAKGNAMGYSLHLWRWTPPTPEYAETYERILSL